jgi:putative radical SAM enzyme (TIGR03279 family)
LLEIARVLPGSLAVRIGLRPGDRIVSINNNEIHDVIDFKFFSSDERISLVAKKVSGRLYKTVVTKMPDDDLGLEFVPFRIKKCRNNCLFCFVDQMPKGCRASLSIKDDDFRASFLHGNYITLGNLTDEDWERIFSQRLSPLYISVHATDTALRASLLRNKKAPDIMTSLRRLAAGGIKMHTQIVLCPGINDGAHLVKTIQDLSGLYPAVSSIAAVPVGLTSQRKKLFPLRPFTQRQARAVLEIITPLAKNYKRTFGTRLVFASDEFYIKAKEPIPPASWYEDFPQIENGVGMTAEFIRDAARTRLPAKIHHVAATVVTGVSFRWKLRDILKRFDDVKGAVVSQVTVKNRFFGPLVTVAGLLTGRDVLHALKGRKLGSMLMIPANALKEDEAVFLDGLTLEQVERALKVKVVPVGSFRDMVDALRGKGRTA